MRFFSFSVTDIFSGRVGVMTAANCSANIPNGGAVGQYYGGWLAVSDEVAMLMNINYTIAVSNSDKPKRVPKPTPPDGVRDMERKTDYAVSMAEKFRSKHGGRDG